jgi:hypothetical protein
MASTIGFPKELMNEIDYTLPSSMSSYAVKVVPSNLSQVQSPTASLPTAAGTYQVNGSSSNIIFDIPAGQSKDVFIDPRFSTLSFRVNYEITNSPAGVTIANCQLRGGAMSHFTRTYTQSQSGVILDDVNSLEVVHDMLVQTEINVASRDVLACMYGFEYERPGSDASGNVSYNQGHKIAGINNVAVTTATSKYYSYCMPLLNSLIGKGASKMFQIGATSKLQVVLQSNPIIPLTFVTTGTATTAVNFRITIDNISLNLQYVQLGDPAMKLLNKTGLQYYSGITYRTSTSTIPSSTSGAISLLTGLRGSSVRALFARFTESATLSTSGCINYNLDSKAPAATSIAWNINGVLVPSNPSNIVYNPAQVFAQTQQAIGSFNNYEFKSGLVPSKYFVYLPTSNTFPTDSDQVFTAAGNASEVINQAQFLYGYSLEKVAKAGILDGMNINSGSTFLNMNWVVNNTNAVTAFFIAKMDVLYILDTNDGSIQVRL